jgi:hypothetical protein
MMLLLQAWIRRCNGQSRRSALRHTARVCSWLHAFECPSHLASARSRGYSLVMRSFNRVRRFAVDCLMKAMFSPRCCSALIFPSSRRFCWSSPNCAIRGPSSWFSDFQIAAHLVCRRTGYVSQGGSAAHAALQLAPSRMNANASTVIFHLFAA